MCFRVPVCVLCISVSLHTKFATVAHLAEGKFFARQKKKACNLHGGEKKRVWNPKELPDL
jgi:hypothetical protein